MNELWAWFTLIGMIVLLMWFAVYDLGHKAKAKVDIQVEHTVIGVVHEDRLATLMYNLTAMGLTLDGEGPHKTIQFNTGGVNSPPMVVGTLIEDRLPNMDMHVYVVILRPAYIAVLKPFGVFIDGRKDYGPHDRKE